MADFDKEKFSRFLWRKYGLQVKSIKKLYAYSDINLQIKTEGQGDYFLKLHKQDSMEKVNLIATTLNHLHDNGVPIARVQETKTGELVVAFDGTSGILQKFVQADVFNVTAKTAYRIGQTMGRLHKLTASMDPKSFDLLAKRYPWNAEHFDLVLEHFEEEKSKMPKDIRTMIEGLNDEWMAAQKKLQKCRRGFIHNDFNDSNLLIDKGEIAAVIDFSEAIYSWYLSDIATAMKYIFLSEKNRWPKVNDFMAGYRSEFKIPDHELAQIPLLIKIRAALSITENVRDHGKMHPSSAYVLRRMNDPKNLRKVFNRLKAPKSRKAAAGKDKKRRLKSK